MIEVRISKGDGRGEWKDWKALSVKAKALILGHLKDKYCLTPLVTATIYNGIGT